MNGSDYNCKTGSRRLFCKIYLFLEGKCMEVMNIAACTDKRFVMPTGVMMYSVCVNNPDLDITFHIITDDSVKKKNEQDLLDIVKAFPCKQIVFYNIDVTKFPNFPCLDIRYNMTQATYYRLLLSEIIPNTIKKILYFDGDIIIRHSLLPLWNTDIESYAVAAVCDPSEGNMEFYRRLDYPSQLGYFNAGVLLVNLTYWREHHVVKDFMECIRTKSTALKCNDQDVLNLTFRNNKLHLPIKYNLHHAFLWKETLYDYSKYENELFEAKADPVIVHFSDEKPWYSYSRQPKHPFVSTFFKYQNQTKWKGVKYDLRPIKRRIINFVADLLRKWKLKAPKPTPIHDYIDIAPID